MKLLLASISLFFASPCVFAAEVDLSNVFLDKASRLKYEEISPLYGQLPAGAGVFLIDKMVSVVPKFQEAEGCFEATVEQMKKAKFNKITCKELEDKAKEKSARWQTISAGEFAGGMATGYMAFKYVELVTEVMKKTTSGNGYPKYPKKGDEK